MRRGGSVKKSDHGGNSHEKGLRPLCRHVHYLAPANCRPDPHNDLCIFAKADSRQTCILQIFQISRELICKYSTFTLCRRCIAVWSRGNMQGADDDRHSSGTRRPPPGRPDGGRTETHRRAACQGQADRTRADRALARRGQFRGIRHVRHPPLHRFRHGGQCPRRGRRGDRLGHGQRPHGLCLQPGFHRPRRLGQRHPRPEDLQDHGYGGAERRPGDRPQRQRRRPHPGRRRRAGGLCRDLPAQHHGLGCGAADLGHHGALCRRRGLFSGDDRFHLHGERQLLHVRHRPRRGEDRDQRTGHRRRAGRRLDPHPQIQRRRRRLRK